MNHKIKVNSMCSVVTTIAVDKESEKSFDEFNDKLSQQKNSIDITDVNINDISLIHSVITQTELLLLIVSAESKRFSEQAVKLFQLAKQEGVDTVVITYHPTYFDSGEQSTVIRKNLERLKTHVDQLLIISTQPSDKKQIEHIFYTAQAISDAYLAYMGFIYTIIGQIGILRFGEGIAGNANRALEEAVVELKNQDKHALSNAKGVLAVIATKNNLTPEELDEITKHIKTLISEETIYEIYTPIIPTLADNARATIICSGL